MIQMTFTLFAFTRNSFSSLQRRKKKKNPKSKCIFCWLRERSKVETKKKREKKRTENEKEKHNKLSERISKLSEMKSLTEKIFVKVANKVVWMCPSLLQYLHLMLDFGRK